LPSGLGGRRIGSSPIEEETMAWSLKGQLYESCSCNMFCPCWFGVQDLMIMDQGWCDGVIGVHIDEGESDGVSLDGRDVILAVHFPGPTMFDGQATARVFIDEGADGDQQQALEKIFHGEIGGPMEIVGGLVSTWLPTNTIGIEVADEGDSVTMSADGQGELRTTLLRDPDGNTFSLTGGGFVAGFGMKAAELAPSATKWSDSEMPQTIETKSGARGEIAWAA
jgi:hypothetical protein